MGVFARRLLTTSARAAARTPALTFPQRRLPDGTRISALPPAPHATPAAAAHAAAAGPVAFIPSVAASPYVGRNSAAAQPPRTTLSKKEMELIELGGAEPYVAIPKKKSS